MKKLVFVSLFAFAACTVNAQIKLGLKAGANFYRLGGKDAEDLGLDENKKIKIGAGAGGFVNIPVNSMFSVQPELLFSQEGNLQKEDDVKAGIHLNYLQLPVMFQYNNPSGFYAETGPQAGLLLSAKMKATNGDEKVEEDIKDNLKSVAFAWSLGAGYKMPGGLGFGARYNFGLSSIDDEGDEPAKISNRGFHVGLFYSFGGSAK